MEIAVKFVIIELHCNSVVGVLVHSPDETDEIETKILSVSSPRSRARLK